MSSPHDRLKRARLEAGFETAQQAADAFGWTPVTYRAHEAGERGFKLAAASNYAMAFGVSGGWLLFGEDAEPKSINADLPFIIEAWPTLSKRQRGHVVELVKLLVDGPHNN